MRSKIISAILLLGLSLLIFSCEKSFVNLPGELDPIPTIYHFERNGASSIDYSGQAVRQLLIQDMKIAIDNLGDQGATPVEANDLLKYFDKSATGGQTLQENILTNVGTFQTTSLTYFDIHPDKDLLGKLHSGYDLENSIRTWIDILVSNSNNPVKIGTSEVFIDESTGLDLAQAINKTLLGAVAFSQGVNTYLVDIESRENNQLLENKNFTDREHRFDEAFGYFGGARNFFEFTDDDLAGKDGGTPYKDNFIQDDKIDFSSEYNFGFSTNAGKRDRGSAAGTNFSKEIMEAFLKGRSAIVNKEDIQLIEAKGEIIAAWEKIIAATVVHYINEVLSDLTELQSEPNASRNNFFKHWTEMYFFAQAFRYNNNTWLDHSIVLGKMAVNGSTNPKHLLDNPSGIDAYKAELLTARDILQSTYNFAQADVEGW